MAQLITPSEQERIAQVKIDSFKERAPIPVPDGAEPNTSWEEAGAVIQDLGKNAFTLAQGSVAGTIGVSVDLMAMATMTGYSGLNWLSGRAVESGGEFTLAGADQPGGTVSIGKAFGADTDSLPFIIGSFLSPVQAVKALTAIPVVVGATTALKSLLIGARTSTKALTMTLDTARGMRKLGRPTGDIWDETGWFPEIDANGKDVWKYVLSDADSVVDSAHLKQRTLDLNLQIGEEGEIISTLKRVFSHPTAYESYPHLQDVPIRVSMRRIKDLPDGTPDFEIYNERMSQQGIAATTETSRIGRKRIRLYLDDSKDFGRQTVLHEVMHNIQAFEGWDEGASSAKFLERIIVARTAQIRKRVVDDIVEGELTPFMDEQALNQYVDGVADTHKVEAREVFNEIEDLLYSELDDIAKAKSITDFEAWGQLRDMRLMIEELGMTMVPDDAARLANQISENFSFETASRLAHTRYRRQAGEIEPRLVELLRDKTQKQINAMSLSEIEGLRDVPRSQAITGDKVKERRIEELVQLLKEAP